MVDQVLGGAVIAVTSVCLVRLVVRRWRLPEAWGGCGSADIAHVLMGIGMSAMFLPEVLPPGVWAALFVANAGWMGVLALRRRPALTYLHHLVGGLAMSYMFAAARPHGPTSGLLSLSTAHSSGHSHGSALAVVGAQSAGFAFPLVAWVLMTYCLLSAGFAGTDLVRPPRDRPRLTATTELVLSLSMVYMFLTTL
ncbi:uncharacterized protein DUF5134 [Saccharopolyspora spinosa]|uniref:Uncharacterized protein DUF5134 n=1 Tax=Saccharopolyspora spinosa TaxID=60894 RepID=A0A2N3XVL0_SACSN|nr:uncharacterized protein DUF5134 [Saccharopolyspora spinosa]